MKGKWETNIEWKVYSENHQFLGYLTGTQEEDEVHALNRALELYGERVGYVRSCRDA